MTDRGTRGSAAAAVIVTVAVVLAGGAMVGVLGADLSAVWWVRAGGAVLFVGVGVVGRFIVRADARNASGWWMLAGALGVAATAFAGVWATRALEDGEVPDVWLAVVAVACALGSTAVLGMATLGVLVFPNGRPLSRRWRPVAWGMGGLLAVLAVAGALATDVVGLDGAPNPLSPPGLASVLDSLLLTGIALCVPATTLAAAAVTGRFRRAPEARIRSALRLVVAAAWLYAASWLVSVPLAASGTWPAWLGPSADLLLILFAAAAWVGIVRYGLLDVRFVLSRALAYGILTGVVLVAQAVLVWLLGGVISGWAPGGLAVVVAVILTLPLRDAVQRRVNLMVYGARHAPASVITTLGERLGAAATFEDALPAALHTLTEALGLRYAAVEVDGERLASDGDPGGVSVERVPLVFASDVIGFLVVAGRAPGRPISRTDRALLDRLAPQLATTVRSAQLAHALRESRDRLVLARDEERRRIRRDLHDGLGPTLAGMVLALEHASRHLTDDPAAATRALSRVHSSAQGAVAEVRRLVYALRPPALDALGLAGAIREQAERLGAASFAADVTLPPLPAAVENATYLVALEAMTNAATHASQGAFRVYLGAGTALELEVADDGPGLSPDYSPGVGIQSMRERAAELGGVLSISGREPRGTLVRLRLPLAAGSTA